MTFPRKHSQPQIVAVIPAYDEARFIGSVVLQVREHVDAVIVVDDGSADETAAVAAAAGATVVRHERNRGKGVALASGFRAAAALRPAAVLTLDADGQHVAGEIKRVVAPVLRGEADIVVGSRYLGERCRVPRHRVLGHRFFNFVTSSASGVSASDSQSGFRAFSRRALEVISFRSGGFSVESEMQFIARDNGLRLVEAPITVHYQDKPKRHVLAHGLLVLNGLLALVGQYRPLYYFGLLGLAVIGAAGLWSLWIAHIFRTTGQLAVGYALIAVILFLAGNTVLTTGIILHSVRGLLLRHLPAKSAASPAGDGSAP